MGTIDAFRRGQVVFHETFGPGRVLQTPPSAVDVEFHDGRRESFRSKHAEEKLRPCGPDGFAARFFTSREAVLRALEQNPREVVAWLSWDLGHELSGRTAKPLLKRLHLFADDVLETAWSKGARKAQSEPPKRRIAADVIRVQGDTEAKELESKLLDGDIHIQSRNAIFKALAEFYESRADENFFLRMLFSPVPVARAHAYGAVRPARQLPKRGTR